VSAADESRVSRFTLSTLGGTTLLAGADAVRHAALRSGHVFAALGTSSSAPVDALSAVAAQRAARIALRRVPAYRAFVEHAGWRDDPALGPAAWVATLPVTDKETYIRPFPVADRCLDGRLPAVGTQIDESSG